jgi:hypothetical protein
MKVAFRNHGSARKKHPDGRGDLRCFMQSGEKLNLTRTIRSSKTGIILPKEGTLVSVTENLGRTLLLVEFANGQSEYLFENEVELQSNTPSASSGLLVGGGITGLVLGFNTPNS